MLNWSSMSSPLAVNEPDFRLARVTGGAFDSYIRSFALAAKAWGHPFFLRFNWEMNGHWFPWAQAANGNREGDSVATWRHVHDVFTSLGATNVTWVWCPTADPYHEFTNLGGLYPGDAYVDWTCLDGYNDGRAAGKRHWRTFDQIYSASYRHITQTIAPDKPFMIGEVASSERGGSKPAWISDMLAKLPTAYARIRAFVWFDVVLNSADWPIETRPASIAAFARGIRSLSYESNTYRHLTARRIEPPA
jgi:beta-mannanase